MGVKLSTKVIRAVAFFLVGGGILALIQAVLTPDHDQNQHVHYSMTSFNSFDENSLDVLFFGQSQILLGISPLKLYEDTGICSYNLGSGAQQIGLSYHLIKRALKTQSPSVIVLTVGSMFFDDSAGNTWRYVMDNLPLDREKIEMAKDFDRYYDSDFWSAIFPVIKYHTRWEELSPSDFYHKYVDHYYTAGYFFVSEIAQSFLTADAITATAEEMMQRNDIPTLYARNGVVEEQAPSPMFDPKFTEQNKEYLRKIQALCEDAGAELLLIGLPTAIMPMQMPHTWVRQYYEKSKELAAEFGIDYIDLMYDMDTGIDFTADSYDYGAHLNIFGAEKATACLGRYLTEKYGLVGNRNAVWDDMLVKYRDLRDLATFKNEKDFSAYVDTLCEHKDDWAVMISVNDEYTSGLGEREYALFDKLGLTLIKEGIFADSYLAVLQRGEVEYEALSPRRLEYATTLNGDIPVGIVSAGYYANSVSSIMIDGKEYSVNQPGLDIVVWDQETGLVLDSCVVNTRNADAPVSHAWAYDYFADYEAAKYLDG